MKKKKNLPTVKLGVFFYIKKNWGGFFSGFLISKEHLFYITTVLLINFWSVCFMWCMLNPSLFRLVFFYLLFVLRVVCYNWCSQWPDVVFQESYRRVSSTHFKNNGIQQWHQENLGVDKQHQPNCQSRTEAAEPCQNQSQPDHQWVQLEGLQTAVWLQNSMWTTQE